MKDKEWPKLLESKLDFCFVPELPAHPELEYHKICIEEMDVAVPIDYPIKPNPS